MYRHKKTTRGTNAAGLLPPLLREPDSNGRPPGYEPGELPTAPSRDVLFCECKGITFFSICQMFYKKNMLKSTLKHQK